MVGNNLKSKSPGGCANFKHPNSSKVETVRRKPPAKQNEPQCARCGTCCRTLFVFVTPEDIAREPKLRIATTRLKNLPEEQATFGKYSNKYLLAAGWAIPCPMLDSDNLCTIYQTRPNICRQWEAENSECQRLRQKYSALGVQGKFVPRG